MTVQRLVLIGVILLAVASIFAAPNNALAQYESLDGYIDAGYDAQFDVLEPLPHATPRSSLGILSDILPKWLTDALTVLGLYHPSNKDNPAISPGLNPATMFCAVPAVTHGGGPFVGTHSDCKNWTRGAPHSGSWQSENGLDFMAPAGSAVLAIVSGTIDKIVMSSICPQAAIYLRGDDGNRYFYQHLNKAVLVNVGQRVAGGDVIAYVNARGGGCPVSHSHISLEHPWRGGNVAGSTSKGSYYPGCTVGSFTYPKEFFGQDPVIDTWSSWFTCCKEGGGNGQCQLIPGSPPGSGGGGGGGGTIGLPRPLPDPFECVAPDVSSCQEPPNSLTPPGYTQENCAPIDDTCARGICFGICLDENGEPMGTAEELAGAVYNYDEKTGEIIGLTSNPVVDLNSGTKAGAYCAYAVADRCGGDKGGCAFVLECEQKRVCSGEQCVLKPGRRLVDDEVSCESNADCKTEHKACLGDQCILVPGPGEDQCGIPGQMECPACVREIAPVYETRTDPNTGKKTRVQVGEEEICERPIVQQVCVTRENDSLYYLKSHQYEIELRKRLWTEINLDEYLIDNPYFGTTLEEGDGGQCAQVHCIDENNDKEITWNIPGKPNECAPPTQWCSNETNCGIDEIIGVKPTTNTGSPPSIRCGDGICSAGEESSCSVDCVLRQSKLPKFPHGNSPAGDVSPALTCSDTTGNGKLDSCVIGGESTILCSENIDCTREFHSTCQNNTCIAVRGPGSNMCGALTSFTDTTSLNDLDCEFLDPVPGTCGSETYLASDMPSACTQYFNSFASVGASSPIPSIQNTAAFLLSVAITETNCSATAGSGAGACGLMQFMPGTARAFASSCGANLNGLSDAQVCSWLKVNPETSICMSSKYFQASYNGAVCSSSIRNLIMSYNAGAGNCTEGSCGGTNCEGVPRYKWECLSSYIGGSWRYDERVLGWYSLFLSKGPFAGIIDSLERFAVSIRDIFITPVEAAGTIDPNLTIVRVFLIKQFGGFSVHPGADQPSRILFSPPPEQRLPLSDEWLAEPIDKDGYSLGTYPFKPPTDERRAFYIDIGYFEKAEAVRISAPNTATENVIPLNETRCTVDGSCNKLFGENSVTCPADCGIMPSSANASRTDYNKNLVFIFLLLLLLGAWVMSTRRSTSHNHV